MLAWYSGSLLRGNWEILGSFVNRQVTESLGGDIPTVKTSKCLFDWLPPVRRLYGSKLKAEDNRNGNRYIGTISEDSPSIGVNICVCTCAHAHLCVQGRVFTFVQVKGTGHPQMSFLKYCALCFPESHLPFTWS